MILYLLFFMPSFSTIFIFALKYYNYSLIKLISNSNNIFINIIYEKYNNSKNII